MVREPAVFLSSITQAVWEAVWLEPSYDACEGDELLSPVHGPQCARTAGPFFGAAADKGREPS